MKKFLSKVLTLALVCAIVVTGTSITSEAKGKKSSKKAKATVTAYSNNAVVNDFVATMAKSNGLTINGKSYNSKQLQTLGLSGDASVTTSPLFVVNLEDGIERSEYGVGDTGFGRSIGFYVEDANHPYTYLYGSDITTAEFNEMQTYGYENYIDSSMLNFNGVWNTSVFAANNVNSQYICLWMQSRGLNTAADVYNYLVANGATFVPIPDFHTTDPSECEFVCVQCPSLAYYFNSDCSGITYLNANASGLNCFSIGTNTYTDTNTYATSFDSGIQR